MAVRERRGKRGKVYFLDLWLPDPKNPAEKKRQKLALPRGTTKAQAHAKEEEALQAGTLAVLKVEPTATLGDYAERWIERRKATVKPGTLTAYRGMLRYLLHGELHELPLDRIKKSDLEDWRGKVQADFPKLASGTINDLHSVLGAIFADALADELILRNPVKLMRRLPEVRAEMTFLEPHELEGLLAAARALDLDFYAMVYLSAKSGIRRGEMLALRWGDLDLKTGTLSVRRSYRANNPEGQRYGSPKSKTSQRTVPLTPDTLQVLREYKLRHADRARDADLVFDRGDGRPFPESTFSRLNQWGRALKAAGIKRRVRWHDLRHSYASLLIARNTNFKVVQELLGHFSVKMTLDLYSHLAPSTKAEAVRVLDEMVS